MSFWSIEIPPKKKVEVVCFLDLRVTKATLGSGAISDSDRTFVKVEHSNIEGEKTTATVAVLHKFEQNSAFDLVFDEGEVLNFYVSGKVPVHLSGYFVDSEEDDEYDEYDDADLEEYMRTREGMEEEEEDEDFEGGEEEEEEEEEDEDDEEDDEEFAESEEVSPEFLKKLSEKVKDVQNSKKRKRDSIPSATSPQQPNKKAKQSPAPPKIRKFKSGLIVEQVQSGSGPTKSQNGKIMKMKYVGRLHASRKVFDRSKKPFVFRLGTGEVIKGWDTGLVGMKVGEKRKLIIPPALGYGRSGSPPDIPPNATLEFDVELVGL